MAFGGKKGHLGIVDMKNMNLIKEFQVCLQTSKIKPFLRRLDLVVWYEFNCIISTTRLSFVTWIFGVVSIRRFD